MREKTGFSNEKNGNNQNLWNAGKTAPMEKFTAFNGNTRKEKTNVCDLSFYLKSIKEEQSKPEIIWSRK